MGADGDAPDGSNSGAFVPDENATVIAEPVRLARAAAFAALRVFARLGSLVIAETGSTDVLRAFYPLLIDYS